MTGLRLGVAGPLKHVLDHLVGRRVQGLPRLPPGLLLVALRLDPPEGLVLPVPLRDRSPPTRRRRVAPRRVDSHPNPVRAGHQPFGLPAFGRRSNQGSASSIRGTVTASMTMTPAAGRGIVPRRPRLVRRHRASRSRRVEALRPVILRGVDRPPTGRSTRLRNGWGSSERRAGV